MKKVIVHGVHRSGTSLCASILEQAGLWFAEDEFKMPAQADNPNGFWERTDVTELNDQILALMGSSWFTFKDKISDDTQLSIQSKLGDEIQQVSDRLESKKNWFLKDPRLCLTWSAWKPHLSATDHIVVHRHPNAVAKSLHARNGIPIEHGLIFWYQQTRAIAENLVHEDKLYHLEFGTREAMSDWQSTFEDLFSNASPNSSLEGMDMAAKFDDKLVNHLTTDFTPSSSAESQNDVHQYIEKAWQYARKGKFSELLSLPNLENAATSLHGLEPLYSQYLNHQARERELAFELDEARTELEDGREINEKLNKRLIDIAIIIKSYQLSKRALVGTALEKLKVIKPAKLSHALDIAKFDHSALNLADLKDLDSTRLLLVKTLIKNPRTFIKKFSLARLWAGLRILIGNDKNNPNARQALEGYNQGEYGYSGALDLYDPKEIQLQQDSPIEFPKTELPKVSIVIPVYNELATTIACLHSIKNNTDSSHSTYEIIIADDASNDKTSEIEKYATGIQIVRNESNLGFLENCNQALKKANGDYIVLLNNDTNVQKGWLSELLAHIQSDSTIGVVGPKLVYPDGRLQEAGGIVFSDGSGWNYGRYDAPDLPQYNYFREVDYISGACLLFSKEYWRF